MFCLRSEEIGIFADQVSENLKWDFTEIKTTVNYHQEEIWLK